MELLNSLLGEAEKSLLFFLLASYVCFRIAPYGVHKADQVVLRVLGVITVLVIPLYYLGDHFRVAATIAVVVVLVLVSFIFLAGIPGLRIKIPKGKSRRRIALEVSVASVLILVARSFL